MLDPALLRPGRFDRKVAVPKPGEAARRDILAVHARRVRLSTSADLDQLARSLPGFSGAQLAAVLNEAALVALKRGGEEAVTAEDLAAGAERVSRGALRAPLPRSLPTTRALATHEAGHATVASLLRRSMGAWAVEPVERVTLQPRGDALTRTDLRRGSDESNALPPRGVLLARLRLCLAGRAGEEVLLGVGTTHAAGDLQAAATLARWAPGWAQDGPRSGWRSEAGTMCEWPPLPALRPPPPPLTPPLALPSPRRLVIDLAMGDDHGLTTHADTPSQYLTPGSGPLGGLDAGSLVPGAADAGMGASRAAAVSLETHAARDWALQWELRAVGAPCPFSPTPHAPPAHRFLFSARSRSSLTRVCLPSLPFAYSPPPHRGPLQGGV